MIEDYEKELMNSKPIENPVTLRYDYNTNKYDEGRPPASHIHFGLGNNTQVSSKRILDPALFVWIVIRHQYPIIWKLKVLKSRINLIEPSIRKD